MKSEKWKSIETGVRTRVVTQELLLTEKQWLKRGYKPIDDNAGERLWTNQHCQVNARYLFYEEVRALTKEERKALSEERKAHENDLRNAREDKLKERIKELEEELSLLSHENLHYERTIFNSHKTDALIVKSAIEAILSDRTKEPNGKVVVLDTETTGLSDTDEILQISIIDTDRNVLYSSYIKPLFHTEWKEAEAVNNITPEMVKDAPTLFCEARKIADIISDAAAIIGYNTHFDLNVLKRFGIPISPDTNIIDVSVMFAPIYGEWSEKYEDYKFQKLTTCAAYYDYEWELGAHNSLADCLATLYCYKQMIKRKEITNYEQIKRN